MASQTGSSEVSATTLAAFSLFSDLDVDSRTAIAKYFKLRDFDKGHYVISATQANSEVYFIVSGLVAACAFSKGGKRVQFEKLDAGMMFGELAAIDGMERSSDCIAVAPTTLAVIPSADFHTLIDEYKPFRDAVIQRLAYMVRMHIRKFYELTTFPVGQRVRFELIRIASGTETTKAGQAGDAVIELDDAPTHEEIASRIGTHREAVTRELKLLEGEGVITWKPGEYVIHDLAHLAIAEQGAA